jgi:hypothetical protein
LIVGLIGLTASIIAIVQEMTDMLPEKKIVKTAPEKLTGSSLPDTLPLVPFPPEYLIAKDGDCSDTIDYRGINLLEDHRVFDFRRSKWLDDNTKSPFGSPVSFKRTIVFSRDSLKNKITIRFSTSGTTVYARCINQKYQYCVPKKVIMADPDKKMLMKSIDIIVDLSYYNPRDTITLEYQITSYNGFQGKQGEWIGTSTLGAKIAKKISMMCYFSKSRYPQSVKTCGYKAYDTTCYPVSNSNIAYSTDSLSFGWLILVNQGNKQFDGIDTKWSWNKH